MKLAERDNQELLDVHNLVALLRLRNVRYAEVRRAEAVPEEHIKFWESKGYEVGKVGTVIVAFDDGSEYTYPLHLSIKK